MTASSLFKSIEYLQSREGIEQSLREKNDRSDSSFCVPNEEEVKSHFEKKALLNEEMTMIEEKSSRPNSTGPFGMINRCIVMKVSYIEIYNESVNDLLDANKRNMEVRDQKGEIIIENLTTQQVRTMADVQAVL